MHLQPITYRDRTVAVAFDGRILLCRKLERQPPGDPALTFVRFMCAYALDVAHGILPGPYRDEDARTFARTCLIPIELLERPALDIVRAAAGWNYPRTSCAPPGPTSRAGSRPRPTWRRGRTRDNARPRRRSSGTGPPATGASLGGGGAVTGLRLAQAGSPVGGSDAAAAGSAAGGARRYPAVPPGSCSLAISPRCSS